MYNKTIIWCLTCTVTTVQFAGGMRETQEVMDFCAKNNVRPNVKARKFINNIFPT